MGAVTVSSGEVVKIGSGGCSFCSISTLSLAEMTWEVLSTPADASQGHGVYAASEQHTLDAFGLEVVDGWRVESRTAILVDHEAGTWSIEDPPDDYRSGGIYARMHWTGSEFLIFGGRAAIPRDSPSDLEVAHYYDGILFDPVGRIWRRMEAARPDDLVARGDGGPSVASVWTSAGLFVWGTSAERTEAWGAIFDVETMTWEQLEVGEDAPPVLETHQLQVVGDDVYLHGGRPARTEAGTFSRRMWRYSLSARTWSEVTVPEWADPMNGTVVDEKLAFVGRCAGGDLYDPATESWSPLAVEGAPPSTGVPRGAGSFLTVTDTYYDETETNAVWVLDLRE